MISIEKIRDEVVRILNDIDPEIVKYQGRNLIEDHILNSFGIVEFLAEIEDVLSIDIDPELFVAEHFVSIEAIIELVQGVMQE